MSDAGNTVLCAQCRQQNPTGRSTCGHCGTPLPVTDVPQHTAHPARSGEGFRQGQLFAKRYVIQQILGRGGMGCIYKAHDNTLKENVALKTLLPELVRDPLIVERFFNEARIARSLSHPNIVRVHDISSADDVVFISMEFLQGKSLREILDDLSPGQRIGIKTVLRIFDELCAALQYAHRYTIHRDIKPENVMIGADGRVKLMDFGISKLMDRTNLTQASMVMGTPQYMSPEQLRNTAGVDGRADVYSVGVMLYEVITGNIPTGVPKPVSEISQNVPPAIDPIIAKCVAPDPKDRYQTAGELREALNEVKKLVEAGSDLIQRTNQPPPKPVPERRLPIAAIATGVIIVVFTVAGLMNAETARKRALAATPIDNPITSPPPVLESTVSFDDWLRLLTDARAEANAAIAELDDDDRRREYVRLGSELAETAADQAGIGNDDVAIDRARDALHLYIGAAYRPAGMVFIPAGTVEVAPAGSVDETLRVDALYIDAEPVTVERFTNFARANDWPVPGGGGATGKMLVSSVTYYDALAFAPSQEPPMHLPSLAQWMRAARYMAEMESVAPWDMDEDDGQRDAMLIAAGMSEWTRSASGGASPTPDFHAELIMCSGQIADDTWRFYTSVLPYGMRNSQVGFRCVYPMPKDYNALSKLVRS